MANSLIWQKLLTHMSMSLNAVSKGQNHAC